jgi:hypothetical protein
MTSRADLNVGYKTKIITSIHSRILIDNKLDEGKAIELIKISAQQRPSHFYVASNLAGSSDLCVICSGSGSAESWKKSARPKIFFSFQQLLFLRLHKVTELFETDQATPRGRK